MASFPRSGRLPPQRRPPPSAPPAGLASSAPPSDLLSKRAAGWPSPQRAAGQPSAQARRHPALPLACRHRRLPHAPPPAPSNPARRCWPTLPAHHRPARSLNAPPRAPSTTSSATAYPHFVVAAHHCGGGAAPPSRCSTRFSSGANSNYHASSFEQPGLLSPSWQSPGLRQAFVSGRQRGAQGVHHWHHWSFTVNTHGRSTTLICHIRFPDLLKHAKVKDGHPGAREQLLMEVDSKCCDWLLQIL
ncbi:hypothetical protein ACQJBY_068885 [Aegilops geniculata]